MGSHPSSQGSKRRLASVQAKQGQTTTTITALGTAVAGALTVGTPDDYPLRVNLQTTTRKKAQSEFSRMRGLLDKQRKLSPFQPVTVDELSEIQDKWGKIKATGSNEALRFFLAHDVAAAKLVWVLDDALYK